ncbi:Gfo/Idh/MocA family protein [Microbacterium sp. A588]
MIRPLKIAVMSFAHPHARAYITALQARQDVELLASDPGSITAPDDPERGAALAAELGIAYADSYDKLMAWAPDGVVICSENALHREDIERAARAGAHVLSEKPLATTVADAVACVETCRQAGVSLMTAFPMRFTPMFRATLSAVRDGRIGTVISAAGVNHGKLPPSWFVDPALSGGGAVMDLTVHLVDLLNTVLASSPDAVYAAANRVLHADDPSVRTETGGLVNVTYGNGAVATIDCSWSQPTAAPNWGGLTLHLIGTKGAIEIAPVDLHVEGIASDGRPQWLSYGTDYSVPMIEEFVGSILEGREPSPSGVDGLRAVEVVAAAQASAASGQVEYVHTVPLSNGAPLDSGETR